MTRKSTSKNARGKAIGQHHPGGDEEDEETQELALTATHTNLRYACRPFPKRDGKRESLSPLMIPDTAWKKRISGPDFQRCEMGIRGIVSVAVGVAVGGRIGGARQSYPVGGLGEARDEGREPATRRDFPTAGG